MATYSIKGSISNGTQGGYGSSKTAAKSNKQTLKFSFDCSGFKETAQNIQINSAKIYLTCGQSGKGSSKEFNLSGGLSGTIQSTGAAYGGECYLNIGAGYNLPNYLKNGGGMIYSIDDSTTYHSVNGGSGYYTEDYLKITAVRLEVEYTILKSSLSSYPSTITIGSQFSYSIKSSADSYQHTLSISINGTSLSIMGKSSSKSGTYTPPATWAQYFPNSKTFPATLVLTTYNGEQSLGSNSYSTTVSAAGLNPSISSIEVSSSNAPYAFRGSTFITTKSNGTAPNGATINSYSLKVYQGNGSGSISGNAIASYSNATGTFSFTPSISGQVILQSTITDSRGNTSSVSSKIVYITNYSSPSMKTPDSPFYRVNNEGTITPQGEYYGFKYTSVSYTNSILNFTTGASVSNNLTMSITIGETKSTITTNPWKSTATYSIDASYIATVKLTDTYGTTITYTFDAPSASYLLHFLHKKNSVGIGCAAEGIASGEAGRITMGWPVYLKDDIHMKEPLPISQGGTGATTVAGAQSALGIINLIYPVGSIYMSMNATNPKDLFGIGTWERCGVGKVPVGVSPDTEVFSTAGNSGGSMTHTLTVNEMPSHQHYPSNRDSHTITENGVVYKSQFVTVANMGSIATGRYQVGTSSSSNLWTVASKGTADQEKYGVSATDDTSSVGGGQPFSTMPPYFVCYMWKRVA